MHLADLTEQLEERVFEVGDFDPLVQILNVESSVGLAHRLGTNFF